MTQFKAVRACFIKLPVGPACAGGGVSACWGAASVQVPHVASAAGAWGEGRRRRRGACLAGGKGPGGGCCVRGWPCREKLWGRTTVELDLELFNVTNCLT